MSEEEDFPDFIPWNSRANWSAALEDAWKRNAAIYEWQPPSAPTNHIDCGEIRFKIKIRESVSRELIFSE